MKTYMKTIRVSSSERQLAAARTVGDFEVSCPPSNAGNIAFRAAGGNQTQWIPGESHRLENVDLGTILVAGTDGDVVTIVGGLK